MLASPFVFVLTMLFSPARPEALGFDCARLLDRFDVRSQQIHDAGGPLRGLRYHWLRSKLAVATWPLRVLPLANTAETCARLEDIVERDRLLYTNGPQVMALVRRLCLDRPETLERLTRVALSVNKYHGGTGRYAEYLYDSKPQTWTKPARENVRRWLTYAIAKHAIGRVQWMKMLTEDRYRVLPVLDATDGHLDRIGLTPADRIVLARALSRENVSFDLLARITGRESERLSELAPHVNPIQWLEYLRSQGKIDASILPEFEARVVGFSRDQEIWNDTGDKVMTRLLYDTSIPYEVFRRLDEIARPHWHTLFSAEAAYPHFIARNAPLDHLDEEQTKRAETFFGRAKVHADIVWSEARENARKLTARLREKKTFANFDEAASAFRLDFYEMPWTDVLDEAREGDLLTKAVGLEYFAALRAALPEILKLDLEPRQARWLLDRPNAFPDGLDLHDVTIIQQKVLRHMAKPGRTFTVSAWSRVMGFSPYGSRTPQHGLPTFELTRDDVLLGDTFWRWKDLNLGRWGIETLDRRTIEVLAEAAPDAKTEDVAELLRYLSFRSIDVELRATATELDALETLGRRHGYLARATRAAVFQSAIPFRVSKQ